MSYYCLSIVGHMHYKKTDNKRYYTCTSIEKNETIISTSKTYIAEYLGISTKTISRHLSKNKCYQTDTYIICRDVDIKRIRRGFAL